MKSFDYSTYLSPFTWRYGSEEMRKIWSEENKRKLWRKLWVSLAKAQKKQGLVSQKELDDLVKHQDSIDIEKAHEIEKEVHHDLMAEIKTYASYAKIGGGKIHLGATSMDIEDNADTIRYAKSLAIVEEKLRLLLGSFLKKIEEYKDLPCMGYTHLQPAEPTTLGYRFSLYAQDLLTDLSFLSYIKTVLKGKGLKGAVGTSASYVNLTDKVKAKILEDDFLKDIGIDAVEIANQTAPRKIEYLMGFFLSSISQTIYKFAFDLRIMQSSGFGEWMEPFGQKQVGSSAMPFKRNPWKAEQLCSFARLVSSLTHVLGENASLSLLERTLDDSANRRVVIPELFLTTDEMLMSANKIISGLVVNKKKVEHNLSLYGPFSATETILMECVKRGGDRQHLHEILRELSLKASDEMAQGKENPLPLFFENDKRLISYIPKEEIKKLLDPKKHVGLAEERCKNLISSIHKVLSL